MISIDAFKGIDLRVGKILEAGAVEGSEKLVKLLVDVGEEHPRTILSGIRQWYDPSSLVSRSVVVVANLEPRVMMGMESNGMVLCADDERPYLIAPEQDIAPGSVVR